MVAYRPFWETLCNSNESTYTLIHHHHISSATINRLRKGLPISTTTINDLCRISNCRVENILEYIPSLEDQRL